VRKKLI